MDTGKPIFAQVLDFLPVYEFHQCVQRCREDSPDRSVERRPCKEIGRNTKNFESSTPLDTGEHIC